MPGTVGGASAGGATPPERPTPAPGFFGRGFWWLYGVAWLPFVALYALALGRSVGLDAGYAVVASVANLLPPALLGVPLVAICRRLRWPPSSRLRFFTLHLVSAAAFGSLAVVGTALLILCDWWLRNGEWLRAAGYDTRIVGWQFFVDLLLYLVVASAAYAVQLVVRLREEEARAARARELATQAELRALRAKLNPHFLFNTLHSLLALVRSDPSAAEDGLEQFGDLLHYALATGRGQEELVELAGEWKFVADYLALERLRLGDRLRVERAASEAALACRVPALCLQPLVENAVRYAVAPRAAGGTVEISAEVVNGDLVVRVRDDGPGADREAVESSNGLGLELVRERLAVLHGAAASLAVGAVPGGGFGVALRLPASVGGEGAAG